MRISDWSSDVCSSDLAGLKALDFPAIERAKLKNGIEVVFARRATVPTVQVAVSFDAGYAADPHNALGTQSLMLSLMDEGTMSLDSIAFAEAKERLGAAIRDRKSTRLNSSH